MNKRSYLEEIHIRNLGIIEESRCEFAPGFNVLTGETGAGKTMILTALNLVVGGKSDSSLVRHGSDRLLSSAIFSVVDAPEAFYQALEDADLQLEDKQLIISRSVTHEGKSKATVNGSAVTATSLSTVTDSLIEIHGQSANHQIVKASIQREILDRFGGAELQDCLDSYQLRYRSYLDLKNRIAALKKSTSSREEEAAQLQEFVKRWKALSPKENELATTADEISRLSSVEDLRSASEGALSALSDEDNGALTSLGAAIRALQNAKGKDSHLDVISDSLQEGFYLIDEAARDLSSYQSSLEADPHKLSALQERKAEVSSLLKKYASSGTPEEQLSELAAKYSNSQDELADLAGGDARLQQLENELKVVKEDLLAAAKSLSQIRAQAASTLSALVTEEIRHLSMPHTTLHIDAVSIDYSGQLKESDFTQFGCDEIAISISAHAGAPKVAIGKGVSGGEMSRIMLALSVVIAHTYPLGTYIFDEVDAGVGGKAAIEVGKRLALLSKSAQVIVVTHLPQVAAWADKHFKVEKSSDGMIVASGVIELSESERVDEIARMLAGLEDSASAREHAAELLSLRQ